MKMQGFSDLKMESPACHPGITLYGAHFTLNTDMSPLFPFINAVAENAVYFNIPETIQFKFKGKRCALYPTQLIVGGFENRAQAVLFFAELSAFINAISDKKESLTPNFKRHKPVPVMEIFKLLPRSNCRECGLPTCLAYAAALGKGEIPMEKCPWLSDPKSENVMKISALFG